MEIISLLQFIDYRLIGQISGLTSSGLHFISTAKVLIIISCFLQRWIVLSFYEAKNTESFMRNSCDLWKIIMHLLSKISILRNEKDIYLKYVIYTKIIFPLFVFYCFLPRNLYVFHKPHTYTYNYQKTEFKVYDYIEFVRTFKNFCENFT